MEIIFKSLKRLIDIQSALLRNKLSPVEDLLVLEAQELTLHLQDTMEIIFAAHTKILTAQAKIVTETMNLKPEEVLPAIQHTEQND